MVFRSNTCSVVNNHRHPICTELAEVQNISLNIKALHLICFLPLLPRTSLMNGLPWLFDVFSTIRGIVTFTGPPERISSLLSVCPILNSATHLLSTEHEGEELFSLLLISFLISVGVKSSEGSFKLLLFSNLPFTQNI